MPTMNGTQPDCFSFVPAASLFHYLLPKRKLARHFVETCCTSISFSASGLSIDHAFSGARLSGKSRLSVAEAKKLKVETTWIGGA